MRLRLVRHARADYARLMGTPAMVDAPLSPQGEAQLPALIERLRGDPPGYVYCSPTLRTMATAHAIASGLGVRPVAWSLLCEESFLHGAPGYGRSELAARFPLIVLPEEIGEGGGTKEAEVAWSRRAWQVLNDLLDRHPREGDDDVLLVTHLGFGVDLVQAILGVSGSETAITFPMGDTAITSLRITPGKVFMEYLGYPKHLKA